MNNERLISQIRELCRSPQPEGKRDFFRFIEEQGMARRRPLAMSHGEFLLGQLFYIKKWIWGLSGILLLLITGICFRNSGNYPFALTPFLAVGILMETRRSLRWKMAEMEDAARFSLRSIIFARMFLIGAVDTVGLLVVILIVRPFYAYSLVRVFLYMMVPYLTASCLGAVYERTHRTVHGVGSIAICFLSSAFFAAAPAFLGQLYEETVLWVGAFLLMAGGLAGSFREWAQKGEEPVWN